MLNLPDSHQFEHPVFGQLSKKDVIKLTNIHLDHHLRQFGVWTGRERSMFLNKKIDKIMSEIILKYNSLDTLGKQELIDFLDFLVQRRQANKMMKEESYQQKILQISTWSEKDIQDMQDSSSKINFEDTPW